MEIQERIRGAIIATKNPVPLFLKVPFLLVTRCSRWTWLKLDNVGMYAMVLLKKLCTC